MEEKGKIEDIINRSALNKYDKEVLGKVFSELYKSQQNVFCEIEEVVREELKEYKWGREKKKEEKWNVITALIEKEQLKDAERNGFEEIVPIKPHKEKMLLKDLQEKESQDTPFQCAGVAFLKCRYEEVSGYCEKKDYKAKITTGNSRSAEIPYRIIPYQEYQKRERIIEKTAAQYRIETPAIYSPMSRRAIRILVDFSEHFFSIRDEREITIDFQYAKNGLEGILLPSKILVWNVSIEDKPRYREEPEKVTPLPNKEYHIYEFQAEEDEFIYFEGNCLDWKRSGEEIFISSLDDKSMLKNFEIYRIKLSNRAENYDLFGKDVFKNYNNFFNDSIKKRRIRTKADAQYVLKQFEVNGREKGAASLKSAGCKIVGKEDGECIKVYGQRDAYYYPKDGKLRGNRICCYVKFEDLRETELYFEDFVSFMMAYMNYFYPEFYWVGVV